MKIYDYQLRQEELDQLLSIYPNTGKNWDIGSIAVKIVEMFFKKEYPDAIISKGTRGADIQVCYSGKIEQFEVKGTTDNSIAWSKLKVSSKDCYTALLNGMVLIRVTSIGSLNMKLHFMKYGEDFILKPEDRYAIKPAGRTSTLIDYSRE